MRKQLMIKSHLMTTTLVALALTVAMTAASADAKTFICKKGYSVAAPQGWTMDTSGLMGTDVIFFQSPVKGFATNINVVTVPAKAGETTAEVSSGTDAMLRNVLTSYHRISSKRVSVDHHQAVESQASYVQGQGRKLYMHQFSVLGKRSDFTFTLTCAPSLKANYDPAFAAMVRSIRVTGE